MKKDETKNSKNLRSLLKFTLSINGLIITDLAKMHGISVSNLCNVFYIPYPKAERIIADALNLQPWDLWPERYTDQRPNRVNRWYLRKSGGWLPKHSRENFKVKGNILGEGNCDQPK